MKFARLLLAFCVALLFSGCLQVDSLVVVKPDGSGTVTLNVVMEREALEQVKALSSGFGSFNEKNPPKAFELLDEAKLKLAASRMGEGVTFVSAKKVTTPDGEGYNALYSFTDINKLKFNQNPSEAMPNVGGRVKTGQKAENVKFHFTSGSPATLVINTPAEDLDKAIDDADKKKKEKKPNDKKDEFAGQLLQQAMKNMKLTLVIQAEGKITKTDADYVDGNRVTMLDLDFNKLLADPVKVAELRKANPKSLEDVKKLMKGVEGVKVESKPSVAISFQ